MHKISIIVPVYNVEKYVGKCLESICNQNLEDIEIVCVDDGSTDLSGRIIDEYASKDKRIKVIHKKNEGYGKAINVGVDLADGKYIGIVESDDYILPEMYSVLYEVAEKYNLEVVKSDFYFFWYNERNRIYVKTGAKSDLYNSIVSDILDKCSFWLMNWTGIYSKKFLLDNNIMHQETPGASYQDNGFWIQVMLRARKIMWIDRAFYMYRQDNPASSMKDTGKMLATMKEYDYALNRMKGNISKYEEAVINYHRLRECRVTFLRIDDSLKKQYVEVIRENYVKYIKLIQELPQVVINGDVNWIEELLIDSEQYCDSLIFRKSECIKLLSKVENIYLYGAGLHAESIFKRLFILGFWDKTKAIIVPDKVQKDLFFDKEICLLRNHDVGKDSLVVIAAAKKNYADIEQKLLNVGITNFVEGAALEECFYAI